MANIQMVMLALDVDELAAQSVIALFEQEGLSLAEGLTWAKNILSSPAEESIFTARSVFDENLLYSEENPGYHLTYNDEMVLQ